MQQEKLIYRNSYIINPRDADYKKDIKPGALINYFIQAAWLHAEELGFGYSQLSESGIGWVLSRFRIIIERFPAWPGEFILETWPKGMDRILYLRDAELYDSAGERMACLTSSWIVIDLKNKRPQRTLPEANSFIGLVSKNAIKEPAPSLSVKGDPAYSRKNMIRYNDIDVNMHLTTYRYIDLMFDSYDLDFLNNSFPAEITVNFIKEIPFGSEVVLNRYDDHDSHKFEFIKTDDQTVCFRGEVIFKRK